MNFSCIRSYEEFEALKVYVESIRLGLSFENFTNFASTNYGDQKTTMDSLHVYLIRLPLYFLIMATSLVGNISLIFVICFNPFMHKSTNFFILNLAVCDLAILVSCMWVEIVISISKYWILGELFCKVNSYMQMVSVIASVLTLVAVSCDRFIGVMYPFKPRLTTKHCSYCIGAIWLLSLIMALPTFFFRMYSERHWSDFVEQHCDDLGWPTTFIISEDGCGQANSSIKRIYYTAVILTLFFLPLIIMSITYSIMIVKLWRIKEIGESYSQLMIRRKKRKVGVNLLA